LDGGFKSQGQVCLIGAEIGSNLECDGAVLVSQSKGLVLDANGADIQGSVFLRGAKSKGGLDFIGATIGGDLDCSAGEFKGAAETPTLNLNRGLQEQAKKLMIAKNKDYATYRRWRMDWLWYGLLGKLVGYGYRPWRAFWVSLSVIVLGWLVFWCGYHCRIITPLDEKAYKPGTPQLMDLYPRFNAFVYSLETFVPFLKLGISDHWTPCNAKRVNTDWSSRSSDNWRHVASLSLDPHHCWVDSYYALGRRFDGVAKT
jgi:hypothetical protein